MLPKNREPTTPGEILKEEFLVPMGMSQETLKAKTGLGGQTISMLINGKRGMTPDTALALTRAFDTTPEFWMNLQVAVDLWRAQRKTAKHA